MTTAPSYRLLGLCHLHHAFVNHYQPLALSERVSELTVIRPAPWTRTPLTKTNVFPITVRPKPLAQLLMLKRARQQLQTVEYDALVAFTPFPYGVLARQAARKAGIPYHIGIIGERILQQLNSPLRSLVHPVLRDAKTISVAGTAFRDVLAARGYAPERIFVLPHGLRPDFHPLENQERDIEAVFIGDLLPVKRVDRILSAWKQLVGIIPGARLVIIGDGPERPSLELWSQQQGLASNVEFAGFQDNVIPWLQRARLLLLASRTEGLPFAMLEAMACGTIPVVNDVGMIHEWITDHHNGRLLPANADPTIYAEAIGHLLLQEPETKDRLSLKAQASVQQLSYPAVTAAWEQILENLVS